MTPKVVRASTIVALACLVSFFESGCAVLSSSKPASSPAPTLSISGKIGPGPGGAGATVILSGAASATTTADSTGNYHFDGLPSGSYTITPSKKQFKFTPASQNTKLDAMVVVGLNFTAQDDDQEDTFSLSGTVTGGAGATVALSGAAMGTTTADASGNFQFQGLTKGSYTITPSKAQLSFSPASRNASINTSNVSGVNFTATQTSPAPTFTISGTIKNGGGAKVTLTGPSSGTTNADASGSFSFSGLSNGTYTITPAKSQYTFSPTSRSATVNMGDVAGVNFSASGNQPTTYSISGTITGGAGVSVTLTGDANASTTTDSSGNFRFAGLANGNYTLTPSKNQFTFSPVSQSATVASSNVTGVNFSGSQNVASGNTVNIYPGQDIAAAVNAAPAGTTFMIYPGTYRLSKPIVPKNGDNFIGQEACAPPASACAAVISGATVIGPQAKYDGTLYEVADQTQRNPRAPNPVCDSGWEGCVYPEDLYFDGVPYKHLSSSTLPTIGAGQWWFDYSNHIIYFHDNPSGHTVETSVVDHAFGGAANNVTIQYLTVEKFANMYPTSAIGQSPGTNPQTAGANWTVQNCEVRLNHTAGVRVNYGIHILNNYLHDNGQFGIGGGIGTTSAPATESLNSAVLIEGNTINHNNYAHFNPGFGAGGVKVGATSGMTLRNNTIQYNEGAGIHFDMNSQNEFVDGNIITDNTDADGLEQEIGYGSSIFRNNVVLRNGAQVNAKNYTYQIAVRASSGVNAYCNVMEISKGPGVNGWGVDASNRGYSAYPPYQYLTTTGNAFHHNTVIWDSGATGVVGFVQSDAAHQPNFFANNSLPDFSTYYLSSSSAPRFVYDDNDSQRNTPQSFVNYQAVRADLHGAVETTYSGSYPQVTITSPIDQSPFNKQVTVTAAASDPSGISKVEFYVDWTLQGTANSAPYSFNLTAASGSHTVSALAYSNAGIRACYAVTLNAQ